MTGDLQAYSGMQAAPAAASSLIGSLVTGVRLGTAMASQSYLIASFQGSVWKPGVLVEVAWARFDLILAPEDNRVWVQPDYNRVDVDPDS